MKYLIVIMLLFLFGCSHQMKLNYIDNYNSKCKFTVIDERPNPEFFYWSPGAGQVKILPPLNQALEKNVCADINNAIDISKAKFKITDFDCLVSGFFTLTYIADIRGILVNNNGNKKELRSHNKKTNGSQYIPGGCQEAFHPVIKNISKLITKELLKDNN